MRAIVTSITGWSSAERTTAQLPAAEAATASTRSLAAQPDVIRGTSGSNAGAHMPASNQVRWRTLRQRRPLPVDGA